MLLYSLNMIHYFSVGIEFWEVRPSFTWELGDLDVGLLLEFFLGLIDGPNSGLDRADECALRVLIRVDDA